MSRLSVDPDEMRQSGYAVVDWLVEQIGEFSTGPVLKQGSVAELRDLLAGPAPEGPIPLDELLERLRTDVFQFSGIWGHPRFFGYIPGSSNWPSALADFVVAACNIDASTWREAAGLTRLEQLVIDWMKGWLGLPPEAEGILVSGGSAANLTALACARDAALGFMNPNGIVYVSDQAHSSLARAARVLGFRPEQVRVLAADREFRMRPNLLDQAIRADLDLGLVPVMAAAAAGSTNTGAIDPLQDLADVCRDNGVWLHVDGAYGAFAALTDEGRKLLAGIELADSVTLDPHKWLYQPFECGGLLVRRPGALSDAFRITPPYLEDAVGGEETNFSNLGLQLSRSSRALKVWLSVSNLGLSAFRDAIAESMRLARYLEDRISSDERLELVSPAYLSVVCFRRIFPGADDATTEELNTGLVAELAESGFGLVSSTRLAGRYAMRMCVFNHTTTQEDVDSVLGWLASTDPAKTVVPSPEPNDGSIQSGWLDHAAKAAARAHSVFKGVDEKIVERVVAAGREQVIPAGQVIVEEQSTSREFYLILEGSVKVTAAGAQVASLDCQSFFGELAALDWGAGFGSPRMATVISVVATRLLRVPSTIINRAMRSDSQLRRTIERTAAERSALLRCDEPS